MTSTVSDAVVWRWVHFRPEEFACSHCGKSEMDPWFMDRLELLRFDIGQPLIITSGYRCPKHPVELAKKDPGAHSKGRAADIRSEGTFAFTIISAALKRGFTGIGVNCPVGSGGKFVHLDDIQPGEFMMSRPRVWSY